MNCGLQIHLAQPPGGTFGKLHTYSTANSYEGYEYMDEMLVVHFKTDECGVVSKSFPLRNVLMVEEFVIDPETHNA